VRFYFDMSKKKQNLLM